LILAAEPLYTCCYVLAIYSDSPKHDTESKDMACYHDS